MIHCRKGLWSIFSTKKLKKIMLATGLQTKNNMDLIQAEKLNSVSVQEAL